MSYADIYPTQPNYVANTDSSAGWAVSGDYDAATCVTYASDSKQYMTDIWDRNLGDTSHVFYSFGYSGVPTYCTISSIEMWAYETVSGSSPGQWKMQIALGGAYSDAIAGHSVNNGGWASGTGIARPGGGSWVRSDLANLQMRIYVTAWGSNDRQCRVDQWLVRVYYDYISLTSLTTNDATSVASTSATIAGSYNANGDGDTEWRMVYGTSTGSYDSPSWTADAGTGSITSPTRNLTGLTAGTTYYYRLEARNSANTAQYGSEKTFTTSAGTVFMSMMID